MLIFHKIHFHGNMLKLTLGALCGVWNFNSHAANALLPSIVWIGYQQFRILFIFSSTQPHDSNKVSFVVLCFDHHFTPYNSMNAEDLCVNRDYPTLRSRAESPPWRIYRCETLRNKYFWYSFSQMRLHSSVTFLYIPSKFQPVTMNRSWDMPKWILGK